MKENISNQLKFKQTFLLFIRERQQNYLFCHYVNDTTLNKNYFFLNQLTVKFILKKSDKNILFILKWLKKEPITTRVVLFFFNDLLMKLLSCLLI